MSPVVFSYDDNQVVEGMPEALPRTPWGTICQAQWAVMYRVQHNLTQAEKSALQTAIRKGELAKFNDSVFPPFNESKETIFFSGYYHAYEPAGKLATWLNQNTTAVKTKAGDDIETKPQRVFRVAVPVASILDDAQKERWQKRAGENNTALSFDVDIKAPDWGGKLRHVTHLIHLPTFVYAAAKALGYEVPNFDLSPLLETPEDDGTPYTETYQENLVGVISTVDDKGATKYKKNIDWNSFLGQQRKALWEALGETNPARYLIAGTLATTGSSKPTVSKFAATSEKLNNCLKAYWKATTKLQWVEISEVYDPKVDAVREGTAADGTSRFYRNRIPVITRIMTEDEARELALRRMESREDSEGSVVPAQPVKDTKPDYPEAIQGSKPVQKKAQATWDSEAKDASDETLKEDYGATDEEISMWRTYWAEN